jgi:hypothetical protein
VINGNFSSYPFETKIGAGGIGGVLKKHKNKVENLEAIYTQIN